METIWNEADMFQKRNYSRICLRELRKPTKKWSEQAQREFSFPWIQVGALPLWEPARSYEYWTRGQTKMLPNYVTSGAPPWNGDERCTTIVKIQIWNIPQVCFCPRRVIFFVPSHAYQHCVKFSLRRQTHPSPPPPPQPTARDNAVLRVAVGFNIACITWNRPLNTNCDTEQLVRLIEVITATV
jgi:hypothetical protein